jgi:hypothetical protein
MRDVTNYGKRFAPIAGSALLWVTLGACQELSGLDDLHPAADGAAGQDASQQSDGSGGASGMGGAGGSAGQAGASAGKGGGGGSAGKSGADGSAGKAGAGGSAGKGGADGGAGDIGTGGGAGSSGAGGNGGASGSGGNSGAGGSAGNSGSAGSGAGDAGPIADAGPTDGGGLGPDGGIVAAVIDRPTGIALSATDVYFASQGAGAILRCPKVGCRTSAPTVVIAGLHGPINIAVHGSSLFWRTEIGADGGSSRTVFHCPLGACDPATTSTIYSQVNGPSGQFGLATDGLDVYFAAGPQIMRSPAAGPDGGAASAVLLTDTTSGPTGAVALRSAMVYYTRRFGGIFRCPLSGCLPDAGASTSLVIGATSLFTVAIDDVNIYWSEYVFPGSGTEAAILMCPLPGCDRLSTRVVVSGAIGPFGVALDETSIYYTDYVGGRVVRAPKNIASGTCVANHLVACGGCGVVRCDGSCTCVSDAAPD